jgi:hypothetical protein
MRIKASDWMPCHKASMRNNRPETADSFGRPRGNRRPLVSDLSAEQLLERAQQYRDMAATAGRPSTTSSLLRLAKQFEVLAQQKAAKDPQQDGS